ncbi:CAP domain-containing protein [Demequina sp.]|uniref:CAP domain-containing protein n=1 Tax=Demequina sp. TaxID=2050685 RepID=UPI003D0E9582
MTEQQDVLDPRRPRRRIPVILLGILPAAIAATMLVAGPHYVDPAQATTDAAGAGAPVASTPDITPGVIAPVTDVDLDAAVQQITVTVPKPKVAPAAKIVTVKSTAKTAKTSSKATVTKAKAVKSVKKASTKTYKQFCANPSNPVNASGSTGKALLSAVNKERAKLGIAPLSWSSSMASVATSWSKSMVKKDAKTGKLIDGLAHNPNRPGSENVAVVYSSAGYSASTAIAKMHKNLVYSNGHCLNLMNPSHSSMGAGVASSSDGTTWYATENFR